jgi:hypothetical protein
MKSAVRLLPIVALTAAFAFLFAFSYQRRHARVILPVIGSTTVHHAAVYDLSPPLGSLHGSEIASEPLDCADCGTSPRDPDDDDEPQTPQPAAIPPAPPPPVSAAAAAVEQKSPGTRPAAPAIESFDGLGVGFEGPQGPAAGRNPSDNSLAAGPNHIVQIVNSRMAIFSKKGKVLYGAVPTNTIFKGFGGPCEERNNGDAVVRYDQLADRWLFVMPIFNRIAGRPDEPYSMCYALSEGGDPLGSYYRYEFRRKLFPDYPRPAVWTDGYYVPSSTGDNVIQKHACVVDRTTMLKGRDASEQCIIVEGVNFLNNADLDGQSLPPSGAPNILMAAGGSQLRQILEDDGIYAYQFHVDWDDPAKTRLSEAVKIPVAPYHYLCDGQLTRCVPQPDTAIRLDAQGDKIMQRLIYRNFGDHESLVAVHSINTAGGGGGVRWYEFRLNAKRDPVLYQQSTYAPDQFYRWMASPAMDRAGNIGIGYSFGGTPHYAGQRFAARLAGDPLGQLTLQETNLATGAAAQAYGNRWEDYATMAMDPSDDCTFWYVGDYYRAGATNYSTRIGAFRLPGCVQHRVSGLAFLDLNHDGKRDIGEPGLAGVPIAYAGAQEGTIVTGANGSYSLSLPADPVYQTLTCTLSARASKHPGWATPGSAVTVSLADPAGITGLDFAGVCTVANRGGADPHYWASAKGKAVLNAHDSAWRTLVNETFHLNLQTYDQFKKWLGTPGVATQLAATMLNVAFGSQDGDATVHDPVLGDWPSIRVLIARVNGLGGAAALPYLDVLLKLNGNKLLVTPSKAAGCGAY